MLGPQSKSIMLRPSLKRRLIVTFVIAQALLAAGLVLIGVFYTHKRLIAALDISIQGRAESVAALVRYDEDATGTVYFDHSLVPPSLDPEHPDIYEVWAERTGLLARSPNWPAGLEIDPNRRHHFDFKWADVHYRGLRISELPVLDHEEGKSFQPQTLTIIYAAPKDRVREQVRATGIFVASASLILLALTALLALWGIDRGLLPLQNLADDAGQISTNNWKLQPTSEVRQIAELRPLIDSMTGMLARLEASFTQQREFLSNATHELKTPVAVLKSTLQSLVQKPRAAEDYRTGIEQSLDDMKRLEKLIEWMLRLARAEQWAHGALRRDLQMIDVAATCEEAIEHILPLAQLRKVSIHFNVRDEVRLRADSDDLQLLWTNLLENAVRYSPEGSSIDVAVQSSGGSAKVTFTDHGSGIAATDLPRIFERFYRGDASRTQSTGGFGLGLAIARALAEAYGGTISAQSEVGTGTVMMVEFPASTESKT
jgi:signal transduction histidine kinase